MLEAVADFAIKEKEIEKYNQQINSDKNGEVSMEQYLYNVFRRTSYNKEDNMDLIRAYKDGDASKIEDIIKLNSGLVGFCVKKYAYTRLPFEDLFQEGMIGLLKSLDGYDESLGWEFSTYAMRGILMSINRYVTQYMNVIRVPAYLYEYFYKWKGIEKEIENGNLPRMTDEEMAARLEISIPTLKRVKQMNEMVYSLEYEMNSEDTGFLLQDTISGDEEKEPERVAEQKDLRNCMVSVIDTLPEKEKYVIERRFGFLTGEPWTLEKIGQELGVSRERIRQIEEKALRRLRPRARAMRINDYY